MILQASGHRARLDPQEEAFLIDAPEQGKKLFLRRLGTGSSQRSVLYVHGATFPSALSVAYRFADGGSWRRALNNAGCDVWSVDFLGFGGSDRYDEMAGPPEGAAPLGLAEAAARQLAAATRFILEQDGRSALSFVTHSWGSMPAALLAAAHPTWIDRIFMFAPLACREGPRYTPPIVLPAWKRVSLEDQWSRFTEDLPCDQAPVLSREDFAVWGRAYLDSEPVLADLHPPSVRTPSGPLAEILRAWHGELAWQPEEIRVPVAIARGEWDGLCTDADAHWLLERLHRASERRDIKISRGTHLMHLETMRTALWSESVAFLSGAPCRPTTSTTRGDTLMQDHHDAKDLPGYNPGTPEVARSPITLAEFNDLKATCLFTDEDMVYLRLSYGVLKDQAEELVTMWRGIIAQHVHLANYSFDRTSGEPDKAYGAAVGKRFAQWVLDTARAEYDQAWLDYQYEIGLRHHRLKKNQTDHADTTPHIRGRDLIGFAAATVAPMRPYLEKGGHSPDVVLRMQEAWWKSMILQVTLWSQPYMNHGDF